MMATSTHEGSLYNGKRAREEMAGTSHDHYDSKRLCDWAAYILLNGIDDDDDGGKMQEDEQGVDSDRLLQMMKSLQDEIVVTNPTEQSIAVQCHEKNHLPNINPPPSYAHQQGELSLSHGSSLSYDRKMSTQQSKPLFIPVEHQITSVKEGPSSSEKQRLIKKNM